MLPSIPLATEVVSLNSRLKFTVTYKTVGTNGHCILDDAYHYLAGRGILGRTHTVICPLPQTPESLSPDSGLGVEVCSSRPRAAGSDQTDILGGKPMFNAD